MSAGLLELTWNTSVCDSSAAPELMPVTLTVCSPASSLRVRLLKGLKDGGSFTGTTVSAKELVTLAAPSPTTRLMVALPERLVAGRMVTHRLAPAAPKVKFPAGTRF